LRFTLMEGIADWQAHAHGASCLPGLQALLMGGTKAHTTVLCADLMQWSCGALVGLLVAPSPTALMIVTWTLSRASVPEDKRRHPMVSVCQPAAFTIEYWSPPGAFKALYPAVTVQGRLLQMANPSATNLTSTSSLDAIPAFVPHGDIKETASSGETE
jgi:hypothetical protein